MIPIGVSSLEWNHVDELTLGSSHFLSKMETQKKLGKHLQKKLGKHLTELASLAAFWDR